ncbi:WhiB family transcriptional regulator [Nocardia fluminea]|uniref:WhiB family transcriptional regulator n=1 Tax=Nocardia fluminea TaxID=134984 RepID=UPI00342AAD8A
MEPPIGALPADLADPRLTGAACVGHAALFDAEHDDEPRQDRDARHRDAADICESCPVLAACHTVAAELGTHAAGVWAGRAERARRGRPLRPPPISP